MARRPRPRRLSRETRAKFRESEQPQAEQEQQEPKQSKGSAKKASAKKAQSGAKEGS